MVFHGYATTGFTQLIQGTEQMEIEDKQDKGYIAVWLTKAEQELYDFSNITTLLLSKADSPKCKVVYFLSGNEDLCKNMEGLLLANLRQQH